MPSPRRKKRLVTDLRDFILYFFLGVRLRVWRLGTFIPLACTRSTAAPSECRLDTQLLSAELAPGVRKAARHSPREAEGTARMYTAAGVARSDSVRAAERAGRQE